MPYSDPSRQRAAKAEHERRRRAARQGSTVGFHAPLISGELRLETAADVLALIESQVAAVLADEQLATAERARTVATLAGLALRAVEAANLVARIDALEHVLKIRRTA